VTRKQQFLNSQRIESQYSESTEKINNITERNHTMNRFIGSGTLPRAAKVNGTEKKAVKFTLAACYGHNPTTKRDLIAYVPCVVFEPAPDIEKLLTQDWRGTFFEVEGHVTTSKFEANGETKYSTDVIVNRFGIRMVDELEPFPSAEAAARAKETKEATTE
jgi:hypothetical protein